MDEAKSDVDASINKWKSTLAAAEKDLAEEKLHAERLQAQGLTSKRGKQLQAATDQVAQLKKLGADGASAGAKMRLQEVEANDPLYFASQKDKQEAEFAALTPAEQERRLNLRRQKQEWEVKKQAVEDYKRSAAERKRKAEEEVERKRKADEDARSKAEAEVKRKAEEEIDFKGLTLLKKTLKGTGDKFSGVIAGTVVNNKGRKLSYVQITFNLYDKSGARVGTAIANVNDLGAGERWNFKATTFGTDYDTYRLNELDGF